jgi:type I restriction enzyme S subunit
MFISPAAHAMLRRSEVRNGDLLITITGNVGRVLYLQGVGVANINQHIARIRISSPRAHAGYVHHFLSQATVRKNFESITTGQAYPQISLRQVRDARIALPQLPEQRAIAEALSDVDALVGALDALIAKKRAIRQGAMQQLLTGKIRLPGFVEEWAEVNMARDSVLKARIGWQGLTTAEYKRTGEYFLVTGTDFVHGRVNWHTCHFVDRSRFMQDPHIQLLEGDVLLTKDGTIGKAGYVEALPGPATLNSGVFVIRPKNEAYVPLYMYYVLTSSIFDAFLARLQAGSTISHLYQKDFVAFAFRAPGRSEQAAIASALSDMDGELAALEARRDKARAIKQGMMQQLLTGRVRLVKPAAAETGA